MRLLRKVLRKLSTVALVAFTLSIFLMLLYDGGSRFIIGERLVPLSASIFEIYSDKSSIIFEGFDVREEAYQFTFRVAMFLTTAFKPPLCSGALNEPDAAGMGEELVTIGEIEESTEVTSTVLLDLSSFIVDKVNSQLNEVQLETQLEPRPSQLSCLPFNDSALTCLANVKFAHRKIGTYEGSFTYRFQLHQNLSYIANSWQVVSPLNRPKKEQLRLNSMDDSRLFSINGTAFVIEERQSKVRDITKIPMSLFSLNDNAFYEIDVDSLLGMASKLKWTPFVLHNELHFVYDFLPQMSILKCNLPSVQSNVVKCNFLLRSRQQKSPPVETTKASKKSSHSVLRGGSPAVHYQGDYYLTIAHSYFQINGARQKYSSQMVLFNVRDFRVVFASSPLFIHRSEMLKIVDTSGELRHFPYLHVSGMFLENENSLVASAEINSKLCYLVRIQGFASLLMQAIKHDREVINSTCEGKPIALAVAGKEFDFWLSTAASDEIRGQMKKFRDSQD